MKIRTDFVTNSSSTCYIFAKRDLTKEELQIIREAGAGLQTPVSHGLGRSSAYGEGADVAAYVRLLFRETWMEDEATRMRHLLDQIGEDNIIFARDSDEGMGGYFLDYGFPYDSPARQEGDNRPTGINDLLRKAIASFEYH